MRLIVLFLISLIVLCSASSAPGQNEREKVKVAPEIIAGCENIELGHPQISIPPRYPVEAKTARIGGLVKVRVQIEANGSVSKVISVEGHELLRETAAAAAMKIRFSPTTCDGEPTRVIGLLSYQFNPFVFTEKYFIPANIEGFADISTDSDYYEPIVFLTENYGLAFGFRDKKFHPNAPLTKGEFAHFLRKTLDLLARRARLANKPKIRDVLYRPYNPQTVRSVDEIDFHHDRPYSESVALLGETYGIFLVDEKKKFAANLPMTQNEIIDYWIAIFGAEAAPVNFEKIKIGDRIISRGEFALFLQESLFVLTYKVLP